MGATLLAVSSLGRMVEGHDFAFILLAFKLRQESDDPCLLIHVPEEIV